jgi:hypothetical protein
MQAPSAGVPDGGSALTLASGVAGSLAIQAANIYGIGTDGYGAIVSVPLRGGIPTTLWSADGNAAEFPAIAISATDIYWRERVLEPSSLGGIGSVMTLRLAGGTPRTIASQDWLGGIAVDGTSVYWTVGEGSSDCTHEGAVMEVAVAGGAPTTLVSGQCYPEYVAVDSTSVYWADSTARTVMRATRK